MWLVVLFLVVGGTLVNLTLFTTVPMFTRRGTAVGMRPRRKGRVVDGRVCKRFTRRLNAYVCKNL